MSGVRRGKPSGRLKVSARIPGLNHALGLDSLAAAYGEAFAHRLAGAVPLIEGRPKTVYRIAQGFLYWLEWTAVQSAAAAPNADCARLKAHLETGIPGRFDEQALRRVCDAYAEHMAERDEDGRPRVTLVRRRNRMSSVSKALRAIGRDIGIEPGARNLTRVTRRPGDRPTEGVPTLAEITRSGRVNWENPDQAIQELLGDAVQGQESLSFDSKMRAIARLNKERLAALRGILEQEFLSAHDRFVAGERLLDLPGLPNPDEIEKALEQGRWSRDASEWVARVTGGSPERTLGLALKWLLGKEKLGRLGKLVTSAPWRFLVGRNPAVRELLGCSGKSDGGSGAIATAVLEHLALGPRGWTAAFGLLMIDTAWNVQPLLDLPADPFVSVSRSGQRKLVTTKTMLAFKNRAGHDVDAVLAESPDQCVSLNEAPEAGATLSGVAVVEMVQRMTRRLRTSEGDGPLFLCFHFKEENASVPAEGVQNAWWNKLLADHADHPVIGGLPITRGMIRKTLTDIVAMENSGDHAPAQLLASHASSGTTMQRYLRSPWFKREMANHIRRFQELFEASLASGLRDVAARLNITAEELEARTSSAMETGLGFACLALADGADSKTGGASRCTELDRCHKGCQARRFVPTEQGLLSLVLANRSLRAVEDEWIVQNPDRWREVWMPLLAETEAYMGRLKESAYRPRLSAAQQRVDARLAEGSLSLFMPW